MNFVGKTGEVFNDAVVVGLSHHDASHVARCQFASDGFAVGESVSGGNLHEFHAVEFRVGSHHVQHAGIEGRGDEHLVALLGGSDTHQHCLGGGGGAVIHGSVGDVHAGEVSHHRLIFKDILQRSL